MPTYNERNPTNESSQTSKTQERHSAQSARSGTRPSASRTGDEIRETVKEAVSKGVSAVAGAVEGISETMDDTHLAESAEDAIRQVGQTATKVVRAAKEETENLVDAFKGEGAGSETGDDSTQNFRTGSPFEADPSDLSRDAKLSNF